MNVILQKLETRYTLRDDERDALRQVFRSVRTFRAGQTLLGEGEAPTFVGALLQGWLCRQKLVSTGGRQILALPLPGDVFDMHSFMFEAMDHSVTAVTACKVAMAAPGEMETLSAEFPRLASVLWRDAMIEASVHREWIVNNGRRNAVQRIAHLFCELHTRLQSLGQTTRNTCLMPLTQGHLSEATGLSVVHVNRVLQRLRAEKLIVLDRQSLTITDWEGLVQTAGFDPAYLHLDSHRPGRLARTLPSAAGASWLSARTAAS